MFSTNFSLLVSRAHKTKNGKENDIHIIDLIDIFSTFEDCEVTCRSVRRCREEGEQHTSVDGHSDGRLTATLMFS